MSDSSELSQNHADLTETILRSLSHDMREPIRSMRRRISKISEAASENDLEIHPKDLALMENKIISIGEKIKRFRTNSADVNIEKYRVEEFIRSITDGKVKRLGEYLVRYENKYLAEIERRPIRGNHESLMKQYRRLNARLQSLLWFSEADGELTKTHFGVSNEIRRVEGDLFEIISERGARISIDGNAQIFADQNRIGQVFLNIFSNAIKYSKNRPFIRVNIKSFDRFPMEQYRKIEYSNHFTNYKPATYISVLDNGAGIPDERLGSVVKPFVRGRSEGDVDGSGLGLAIVRAVMFSHGGGVGIESKVGVGTRIRLVLPTVGV